MCRFEKQNSNDQNASCKKGLALQQVKAGVEDLFSLPELQQEICQNPDSEARAQCPAYIDLTKHGRASDWCK